MDQKILFRLTKLVEAKDSVTASHTWRVALYTQAVAEAMRVQQATIQRMMRGAALHDLGKIDIPSRILNKPSTLTGEEFEIVKQHPVLGYDRLVKLGVTDEIVLDLVRSHHERLDGSGYPDGLEGGAIPLVARVFAVIDTFDSMTSSRPYRRLSAVAGGPARHDVDSALDELDRYAGIWYCADTVEVFTQLFTSGRLDWIHKHFNDGYAVNHPDSPRDVDEIAEASRRFRSRGHRARTAG